MKFPVTASHPDKSVWYRILSTDHFIEWKRIGPSKYPMADSYQRTEIIAEDYSTALYIQDLIEAIELGRLTTISDDELPYEIRSL